ncbi:MAG: NAD-dependent epimerase/dehydratase family protein [Gammaproteobacteria bacterium]|jgi:nucleoside-diphosphate-sugar epimerase|nr:NAD-dependent epimerase/dehydratase family protein [Gammaproteobacteria bacterium]
MTGTVLIAGASGLIGTAAAIEFSERGWRVIALSRRPPELLEGRAVEHVPLDLTDRDACARAAAGFGEVTHLVYAAVHELPGLIAGWSAPEQIETNDRMLRNLMAPLVARGNLRHVSLLQGTKAYGAPFRRMRVPARESQPRVEHPNFYWVQQDYLAELAPRHGFSYTIFRPQLVVGPNHGVVMNLLPVLGVYAAIRETLGQPLAFPGGPEWVWEAADVRLVAAALRWAAEHPALPSGEIFNLTNGEVFSFRDMWPAIAEVFEMEVGPDEPLSLAEYIPAHEAVWRLAILRHGLREIPLNALLGESHFYADMCLAHGATEAPPPVYVSTVKIRKAGFDLCWNTEESFVHWLRDLQQRRILPRSWREVQKATMERVHWVFNESEQRRCNLD